MKAFLFLIISLVVASVNGILQTDCIVDVGFLLDGSKSLTKANWRKSLLFVRRFERHVHYNLMGTRIGVVSYGGRATVNIKLNAFNDARAFEKALLKIPYKNANHSSLTSGIRVLRHSLFSKSSGDRKKIPNVGIILTDAASVRRWKMPIFEAYRLKKSGTKLYVIITKPGANKHVFKYISSQPTHSYVYGVHHPHDLYMFVDIIVNAMCRHNTAALVWFCSFEKSEPHNCDIEDDLKADFLWNRRRGRTKTRKTGPDGAFDGSYYAYIESSRPRMRGDKAVMYLPFKTAGKFCLSFYYNMFGANIGALEVFLRGHKGNRFVWRKSGPQGRKWHFAEVFLNLAPHDKIAISATRGSGSHGDIGLDLLRIRRGPCVEKLLNAV